MSGNTMDKGEETKERIRRTAARLFGMKGLDGVSMRALAAEAGVNLAAVNYHFGGKLGLYEAVIRGCIDMVRQSPLPLGEEFNRMLAEAAASEKRLARFAAEYVKEMARITLRKRENTWAFHIISRELDQSSPVIAMFKREIVEPILDAMEAICRARFGPEADNEEVQMTVIMLSGTCTEFLKARALFFERTGWDEYTPENIEKVADFVSRKALLILGWAADEISDILSDQP